MSDDEELDDDLLDKIVRYWARVDEEEARRRRLALDLARTDSAADVSKD